MTTRPLAVLLSELHSKLLSLRNVERFVKLDAFGIAYNLASDEGKRLATRHIDSVDKVSLTRWTRVQLRGSMIVEELPVTELRKLCGELGVRGYRHLSKASLVTEIKVANL